MHAFERFAHEVDRLFTEETEPARRWERVGELMPLLLDDPDLRAAAANWPLTQTPEGYAANLLLYEDAKHRFVVNALVKAPRVGTPVHDHAHTWTVYGVITGSERVVRYDIVERDDAADRAQLRASSEYEVAPGYVDVVPPDAPHAEFSGDERTVAIIVRSERIGGFPQGMYDLESGRIDRRPGPQQIPFTVTAAAGR